MTRRRLRLDVVFVSFFSSHTLTIFIFTYSDGAVGKTCMLISYTKGEFPSEYVPTIFDNYSATVSLKSGGSIQLNLWDTAGQEDYDHIRALAYKDVDCFLVCFSVDSQSSFSNVKQKWIPSIIDSESSDASIVLVGTKQDLRNDKKVSSALKAKGSSFVSEQDVRRSSLFLLSLFETNHIRIHTGKKS